MPFTKISDQSSDVSITGKKKILEIHIGLFLWHGNLAQQAVCKQGNQINTLLNSQGW